MVVLGLAGLAPGAGADHGGLNPGWPELLPGDRGLGYVGPRSVEHCRQPRLRCVDRLVGRLRRQWRPLNAACDGRGVATLAYLRINEAIRSDLARDDSLFDHKRWFERVLTTFSNRYFASYERYELGRPVPRSWQIAFDAQSRSDITAGQEILLFSNAHVQHDLPFAYVEMGLVTEDGRSRKHDHDAFNEINNRILDPVADEVARRYDPTFPFVDLKPLPVDEVASQEFVKLWREYAWRNAERLARVRSEREWDAAVADIDRNAELWARMIAAPQLPGLRASRDTYCRAQQASGAAGPLSRR